MSEQRAPLPSRLAPVPWLFVTIPILIWGGNVVAAKSAATDISPMMLTTLRWFVVFAIIFVWSPSITPRALREARPHWRYMLAMGAIGFTCANALFFIGARYTSGVNIAIIPGVMPAFVLVGMWLFIGAKISLLRATGAAITILGVAVVATKGDLTALSRLDLNRGDLLQMLGSALYAAFTIGLRKRPQLPAFPFFIGLAFSAMLTSLPLLGVEALLGESQLPGWRGLAALVFVAIFTSIIGHSMWIKAIDVIGPSRAGIFQNLTPIVGAALSVLLLGEEFHLYHAASLGLVLGGIWVSERLAR